MVTEATVCVPLCEWVDEAVVMSYGWVCERGIGGVGGGARQLGGAAGGGLLKAWASKQLVTMPGCGLTGARCGAGLQQRYGGVWASGAGLQASAVHDHKMGAARCNCSCYGMVPSLPGCIGTQHVLF